ncbi:MAG: rhomboid family intramembrane serine protease [Treponema sp.]|nr:rhomboid family intramembrane serine protease [Treponema sp.]
MKIKYNAPTILTYALLCAVVMALTATTLLPGLIQNWFRVPGKGNFLPSNPRHWLLLLTHAAGHSSWGHLVSNFSIILLIGPMLEECYSSLALLAMIIITALVTGILNVIFFTTGLMGASGAAFMMILLASFTNFSRGEIPLTFILVLILYLGNQLFESLGTSNISHFAHIVGGFCGSLFGFLFPSRRY